MAEETVERIGEMVLWGAESQNMGCAQCSFKLSEDGD